MARGSEGTGIKLKISELKDALRTCMKAKIPSFVHGSPGIGKSDAVKQLGKEQNRPVIDLRMSLLNPVDLRGVPVAKDGVTAWWSPSFLPRPGTENEIAILFLDEMNAAAPSVQSAAYQLVLDRKVGEYTLPDGVDVIAAGNLGTDRAIVYEMSSALRNRFVHFEVRPDLDDWKDWAMKSGIRSEVVSYLNYKQQHLFFFDPKVHIRQFPTPRSWAYVSRILDQLNTIRGITPMLASALGDGVATEFAGFLKVASSLPNAEDVIIKGKLTVKAPSDAAELYAYSGALVGVAIRADNDKEALEYGKNLSAYCAKSLPAEFAVLACKDYARTEVFSKIYNKLIMTPAWKEFSDKHGESIVH
jgi:hypothetical protein